MVDRSTVKFILKEPYVWLLDVLATSKAMWIVAREVVEKFGDLKKPESAIGTGPFLLERYEPNVKTVFTRHPEYFLTGLPWVDGVEWLVLGDPSTGLAMYRAGQLDCGPESGWRVRQHDLESLKQSHPQLLYQDFLFTNSQRIFMRTDQPPFNDVRVRRAISQAIDRQALIEAVWVRGEPTAAVPRGLREWSLPIDQLGSGRSTISMIRKRPSACWRRRVSPPGSKRCSTRAGALAPTSSMPCNWCSATSKTSASRQS